jgi:hypothetical protein
MDNITEVVALLRKQTELERELLNGRNSAVSVERDLEVTLRRLAAHPHALSAVLQTARALRRAPDAATEQQVADWSSN